MCSKLEQQQNQHLLQFHPLHPLITIFVSLSSSSPVCALGGTYFPAISPTHIIHLDNTLYCNLLPFLLPHPQHSGLIPLTLGEWGIHEYIFSYRRHRHCHHHHIHLLHCTISSWSREIKATTPNFSIRSANRSPYQRPPPSCSQS